MTTPDRRPTLRSVALPTEHGGWGLTLEPGLLGLLLAPSIAGLLLGIAALLAFLLRTPLRLVLLGRLRAGGRMTTAMGLERTRLATRVAGVEVLGIVVALSAAVFLSEDLTWLLPLVVAAPLFAIAFWFDMRSLSRHLVLQIVGSVAVAGVAAMSALAGGAAWELALGAWLILSARVLSSIPHVRTQVARLHGREVPALPGLVGDLTALLVAGVAVLLDAALALGALSIVVLIIVQRITLARPPRPAKVLGVRQMALGFAVVAATAAGAWLL